MKPDKRTDLVRHYEAIEEMLVDVGISYDAVEQRIDQAMVTCRKQNPELDQDGYQLIRQRLRRNYLPDKNANIDSHRGHLQALRLPLSRIAEVF